MSAIGQTVKRLREEHGWTQAELGEKVGLDRTNIARRESGQTRVRAAERFKFAEAFGMSVVDFDEQWRQWSVPRTRGGNGIPVINRAPAGQIIDYEEYGVDSGQGFEYIDFGLITDPNAFAVIVVGDSMQPALSNGDQLVLSPVDPYKADPRLTNGTIVFVRFTQEAGGGCTLARLFDEGEDRIRLHKDNPKYAPVNCARDAIQGLAIAIERRVRLV
jgi:SOS-response transcriptional repressor LexA